MNNYDGARATTVSFDTAWKFHLGDVSGAQATTFDDSSWTSLDVPHDWSISLSFTQNSPAGGGGGYLNGGTGWYRKTFTLPSSSSGQKVFVQFDGVYMDSTVYLNGTQVGAPAVRVFVLRVRPDRERQVRRLERARRPGQQPAAEQPLVLGQRDLPAHLAQDGEPGPRGLHRHGGDDAAGLELERHREHRRDGPERRLERPVGHRGEHGG